MIGIYFFVSTETLLLSPFILFWQLIHLHFLRYSILLSFYFTGIKKYVIFKSYCWNFKLDEKIKADLTLDPFIAEPEMLEHVPCNIL